VPLLESPRLEVPRPAAETSSSCQRNGATSIGGLCPALCWRIWRLQADVAAHASSAPVLLRSAAFDPPARRLRWVAQV